MTNETKLEILNYVVNNIEPTNPNNDEIFLEQYQIDRDQYVEAIWKSFPEGTYSWHCEFEGMIESNELTSNLSILYGGGYYLDGSIQKDIGLILLIDENFNIVKGINSYSSGTPLRYIQCMKQAEDGTFYLIDDNNLSKINPSSTSQKRFVMTNNFTLKNQIRDDYEVVLRTSYIFGSSYQNFYCREMYKDADSSHYIFFGQALNDNNVYNNIKIIDLKINVGMPNEWNILYQNTDTLFGSAIAVFNTEDVKFRCLVCSLNYSSRNIECISKTYTGTVQRNNIIAFDFMPYIDSYTMENQSVFLSYDEVYFVQNNQHIGSVGTSTPKYIGLYKYNFNTQTTLVIYSKSLGSYDFADIENIYITKCDTDIYVMYCTTTSTDYGDYYINRLVNDVWNPIQIAQNKRYIYSQVALLVKSNFNLLQIYIYAMEVSQADFQYLIKEDYNSLNYNGTSYIGYDTLVSRKGQIYSDNKLVFARNLYNKNIYNNTCVSTIQVPNNYLNGIQLDLKKLISNTNFEICNENNITDKNIYEMMFINYINNITCIDEDTGEIYSDTASYVNTNINTGTKTNYDNTKLDKVRINFTTPQIQKIDWTWNVDHYETEFTIYTSEIPTSIDFISDDESTIYITKQLENLETNKYYTISQKIRIE